MVHTQKFGDMQVPVPGFGAMGMSFGLGYNLTLEQAEPVLLKAIELGCTFWDTAVRRTAQFRLRQRVLTDHPGCLPSRCQRETPGRLHQEAQRARQDLPYVWNAIDGLEDLLT